MNPLFDGGSSELYQLKHYMITSNRNYTGRNFFLVSLDCLNRTTKKCQKMQKLLVFSPFPPHLDLVLDGESESGLESEFEYPSSNVGLGPYLA